MLTDDHERDGAVLAGRFERSATEFVELIAAADLDRVVAWHGGVPIPVGALGAVLVNEFEIHGLDVAHATGRPWTYPPAHALMAIEGLLTLSPHYLDQQRSSGFRAAYALRPRGGPPAYVRFDDAVVTVHSEPPGPIDCRLIIDPVAYVLVAFGRRSRWEALGRGQVVAWGRKPWLGLRFASMFLPT
jgi:uncharacterized protein (TIGR03083 family)